MKTLELDIPTSPPLGATLTLPDSPVAAALIHQGSGVHDRDGNMPAVGFQSTLYRRVARELATRANLASLRFDKRGHDKPAEYPHTYGIPQRLDDARRALGVLREHQHTRGLPTFLIGHSEGALVVAKLAETEKVRGVVSLAAPFGNVFELNRERAKRLTTQATGATAARGELALEYYDKLERHFREGGRMLPEDFVKFARPYRGAGYAGWESCEWLAGHWAEGLKSDPTKGGAPMLVVQGGRDARLWDDNARRWQAWCAEREAADYVFIEHMGHDLNDARHKVFRVDDEVLDTVADWVKRIRNAGAR